jgi:signal transduction histidine kinase
VAAARLDDAVAAGVRDLQKRLDELDAISRRRTFSLALLALAGAAAALWLGLAVRRGALLAETRRRELLEAIESKARFTRGVSHDLKNPLGVIDGHAQLLELGIRGPITPEQGESIAHIRRSVRALLALVDDLLALAQVESGELDVRPETVDMHALLREVAEEHRAAMLGAGLALDVAVPTSERLMRTDPTRVRQVLGNLLSNARKYTPRGGRTSLAIDESDGSVRVMVSDTGPGIPAEHRDLLFREFSRLPGTSAPGAGLGLAIARRVAHLLGGDLRVDDVPAGQGARFVLQLPVDGVPRGRRGPHARRSEQAARRSRGVAALPVTEGRPRTA